MSFRDVATAALHRVEAGAIVFQQWTCSFCGERVTVSEANVFFTRGSHEGCPVDPLGETNIETTDCNYLAIQAGTQRGPSFPGC